MEAGNQTQSVSSHRFSREPDRNVDRRININTVCDLCGGVSHMTIWRWLNDPALNFPRPIYIGRRRYWREADIAAWLDARECTTEGV